MASTVFYKYVERIFEYSKREFNMLAGFLLVTVMTGMHFL